MERGRMLERLHELRVRGQAFQGQATTMEQPDEALVEATLAELGVALEELRVVEEELHDQGTELAASQQAAVLQSRRYRALFELAPDPYLVTDAKGTVTLANHAAGELLGVRPDALIGKPLAIFLPVADRHAFRTRLARIRDAGGAVERLSTRVQRRSGGIVPVSARVRRSDRETSPSPRLLWTLRPDGGENQAATADVPTRESATLNLEDGEPIGGTAAAALHHVVTAITHLVHENDAAGCGVMLLDQSGALRWVTVSDERTARLEDAQADLKEGPCLDALVGGELNASADVSADPRYPQLGPVAAELGIRAAVCVPIELDGRPIGTLNLFLDTPTEWSERDLEAMDSFAGMVAVVLRTRIDLHRQETLADELQRALHQRIAIEQAKGILMSLLGVDPDEAWGLLRDTARRNRRKAIDLALEIVSGRIPPLAR